MPRVIVQQSTYEEFEKHTLPGHTLNRNEAIKTPEGYAIELSWDTIIRLRKKYGKDIDLDTAIRRLFNMPGSGVQ